MAEWFTVTTRSGGMVGTFSAIGRPFSFVWASQNGAPEKYLRCYPETPPGLPGKADLYYDLIWRLRADADDEEIFEDGWYLSGIGHHLLWCGAGIPEAVDAAQEHIAWDGSNAHGLSVSPVPEHHAHAYPIPEHVWQADPYWNAFFGGSET